MKKGNESLPKSVFSWMFMGFCFLLLEFVCFFFTSLLQFGIFLFKYDTSARFCEKSKFTLFFLLWPTSIIVAQKIPKKRKNTDDGRSLPVT